MSDRISAHSTVSDAIETLAALASTGIAVRSERCVRVRNRHAQCRRCADACTSGAIVLDEDSAALEVDASLCVGCGTCATACPTSALEPAHPNDNDLIDRARASMAKTGGVVVVACYAALSDQGSCVRPDSVVGVTCLSRMEESVAVTLYARGASDIVLVRGDCETCPRKAGISSAHLVQDTVRHLCAVWNVERGYDIVDAFPACVLTQAEAEADWDERCAIANMPLVEREHGNRADSPQVSARLRRVQTDGTLPHFVPFRRERLLNALSQLGGEPACETVSTRLWGYVRLDAARCRSCTMCTVFCPTGALTLLEGDDGSRTIEHYPTECVHCLLCQDICFGKAIECTDQVPARLLAGSETERHRIPQASWKPGPDQILQRMRPQISGNEVTLSYASER